MGWDGPGWGQDGGKWGNRATFAWLGVHFYIGGGALYMARGAVLQDSAITFTRFGGQFYKIWGSLLHSPGGLSQGVGLVQCGA